MKSESFQVIQIYETSLTFKVKLNLIKNEPETNDKKTKEESKNLLRDEFNINLNNNQKKMPNFAHFGGKPFQNKNNNDPFENMNDIRNDYMNVNYDNVNQNNNNRNNHLGNNNKSNDEISNNRKKESSSVEKKDPMIWDAPDDKINRNNYKPRQNPVNNNYNKQPAGRKISNPNPKQDQKIQNYSDIESGNNARKFAKNDKKVEVKKENVNNNKKNQGKDGDKKTFLMERYPPNGVGPDSELIEMLEREVVDTNPCVKFEDIAELDGAKNILKEAVLLPLLMPQYFKVY